MVAGTVMVAIEEDESGGTGTLDVAAGMRADEEMLPRSLSPDVLVAGTGIIMSVSERSNSV